MTTTRLGTRRKVHSHRSTAYPGRSPGGESVRTAKRMAVLPAFLLMAACGPEESKQKADLSFLNDLELAVSASDSATLSPDELRLAQEDAPEQESAPTVAKPASSGSTTSSAPRRTSASTSQVWSPAPAPQARVETVKHTKRDAAIGAGAGAVLGAVVAGRGERVQGAAIGAVVGGVLGGVIGNNVDKSTRVVYD